MAATLSVDDMCRLCLIPFVESVDTIENPTMKEQLEKIFSFPIEFKDGISSSVCQVCSNIINDFYEYSEKVRQNQLILETTESNVGSLGKLICDDVKIELTSDSELPEVPTKVVRVQSTSQVPPKMPELHPVPNTIGRSLNFEEYEALPKVRENSLDKFLNQHLTFTCDLCNVLTPAFADLRNHFLEVHQRQDVYVKCCDMRFYRKRILVDHVHYHLDPTRFQCEQCKENFMSKNHLAAHTIDKHEDPRVYKCNRCPRAFASPSLLTAHLQRHEGLECIECRKTFTTKRALNEHMQRHIPKECPQCKTVLPSQTKLNRHIAQVHEKDTSKIEKFVCELCGQELLCRSAFKRHMGNHEGIPVPKIQCKLCERWIKAPYFKNHMEAVHANRERVHECDICHRKYHHPIALQNHKSKAHIEPRFQCEYCDKTFIQRVRWEDHLTTHTGAVLHSCEYCGAPYKTRSTVLKHIRKKHPAEWETRRRRYYTADQKTEAPM